MIDLTPKTPFDGLLPLDLGGVRLSEGTPGAMTSVSPFAGPDALSKTLGTAHGLSWPAPGQSVAAKGARIVWFGRNEALLIGPSPDPALSKHAALVDQSDAWAIATLEGAKAEAVLARLVPMDLRQRVFDIGAAARTPVMHMNASITRTGVDGFMILVFRSMAKTLHHDLKQAMAAVATRR